MALGMFSPATTSDLDWPTVGYTTLLVLCTGAVSRHQARKTTGG
jgi:hypothetical protein